MTLLIGTETGVFRVEDVPFQRGEANLVLECGDVSSIEQFDHVEGIFLTAETGLYRSRDDGRTWEEVSIPVESSEVWSVLATVDGMFYVGTNDPYLFRSRDGCETWTELSAFRTLPSRGVWESPKDAHRARLRTVTAHPDRPDKIIVGMEVGGVHVSPDGGSTWIDHRENSPDDVHDVIPLSPDVYIAATGHFDLDLEHLGHGHAIGSGGVYRTTDSGETWRRLDVDNDYSYVRGMLVHEGKVLFGGATAPPPEWRAHGTNAALFESHNLGRSFERVSYPGEPAEIIEAWTTTDDAILCGSALFGPDDSSSFVQGRIMQRTDDGEYDTVGGVPNKIRCLNSM